MRPTVLIKENPLHWVINTLDPATSAPVDADSLPTVAIRKNGTAIGDAVTITKRSATTGVYDCSYDPAGEVEGDNFTFEETATIASIAYPHSWSVAVKEPERGTDNASTHAAPDLSNLDVPVSGRAAAGDAMTLTPTEREDVAGVVDQRLLDEGDATDLIASIVARVGNTNVDEAALVGLIRADLERAGGLLALIQAAIDALPGEISSSGVTVTDITIEVLRKFLTEDTGETTAATGSVGKVSQGAAGDVTDQLNRIEEQTSRITKGKIHISGTTVVGSDEPIYKGSDYRVRSNTAYPVQVDDVGGALMTVLKDSEQIATIIFGAGRLNSANDIVGTVNPDDITNVDDVTTILVEITKEQLACAEIADGYEYHVKGIAPVVDDEPDGDEVVKITGCFDLRTKRAAVTA